MRAQASYIHIIRNYLNPYEFIRTFVEIKRVDKCIIFLFLRQLRLRHYFLFPNQHERFLRLPEVMHLCGLSRSTIYDLISRDAFPKQIPLGGKNVAWAQSEVSAWMADRISARGRGCDA